MLQNISFVYKGIWGRRQQSLLLLVAISLFFAFITASLCYFASAHHVQMERRYDLYGQWEAAEYSLTSQKAAEFLQIKDADYLGVATQAGAFVNEDMVRLGSIGHVDEGYLSLGRLRPLNGRFPQNIGEIAMTVNALDSLGYSYELGQAIRLSLIEADYPTTEDAPAQEAVFTLCGILPSYEIFWNIGGQLPVTAFLHPDASLPLKNQPLLQVFYAYATPRGQGLIAGERTGEALYNAWAYPEQDEQNMMPVILVSICLLLAFFAAMQLFSSALRKRVRQRDIMRALGASKKQLQLLYLLEGLLYLLAALPLGVFVGLGLCLLGLWIQGSAAYFVIAAVPLLLCLLLCAIAVLFGFWWPILQRSRDTRNASPLTRQDIKLRKRVRLTLPIQGAELGLLCLCLILSLGCIGAAHWKLLPYEHNKDRAAINVTAKSKGALHPNLLSDLDSIPQVLETSALSVCQNEALLSSSAFLQSAMLQDLYQNGSLDQTGQLRMRAEDVLSGSFRSAEPTLLNTLAGLCEDPATASRILSEQKNAAIFYMPYLERDPESGAYIHVGSGQGGAGEPADTGLEAGQTLTLTILNYVQETDREYEYTREIYIAGIIRSFPQGLLATNNTPIPIVSLFAGRGLWTEAIQALHYSASMESGYTHVNIRLKADAGFSVRQSITSIAQKRGGMIRANSYETLEQAYQTGMQSAFLFGVGAVLTGIMGMLLMQNIFIARLQAAAAGIGLLTAIGLSRRAMRYEYAKRAGLLCAVSIVIVTLIALLIQWAIQHFYLTMGMNLIFTMGRVSLSDSIGTYPWPLHWGVCALIAIYVLTMNLTSLGAVLKKSPVENMKGL